MCSPAVFFHRAEQYALAAGFYVDREQLIAQKLAQKFPTAALAVLDFEIVDWGRLKPGLGRLVDYMRPKDLDGGNGGDDE